MSRNVILSGALAGVLCGLALLHPALAEEAVAEDQVALTTLDEGACVQALHVGPYADEGPLIQRMHAEAAARGRALRGRHHEIYLSDPARVAPERLKTILRQPVT